MGRDANKGRVGSKIGSRRGDPKLNCVFSTSPTCLCFSVAYRYLRKEYISDFKIELIAKSHPYSQYFLMRWLRLGSRGVRQTRILVALKSLGTADWENEAFPPFLLAMFCWAHPQKCLLPSWYNTWQQETLVQKSQYLLTMQTVCERNNNDGHSD